MISRVQTAVSVVFVELLLSPVFVGTFEMAFVNFSAVGLLVVVVVVVVLHPRPVVVVVDIGSTLS